MYITPQKMKAKLLSNGTANSHTQLNKHIAHSTLRETEHFSPEHTQRIRDRVLDCARRFPFFTDNASQNPMVTWQIWLLGAIDGKCLNLRVPLEREFIWGMSVDKWMALASFLTWVETKENFFFYQVD